MLSKIKQIVIQKSGKGNSIVIVDRDKYVERMENFWSDQSKFQIIALKDGNFLNFVTSEEKRIDEIYKKLDNSNSMSEETRRHLKAAITRPRMMYGSCKLHKKMCRWLSTFQTNFICFTNTYKPAKYLLPVLEPLTKNKYTSKDSFNFATEIAEQDSSKFMGSVDINSLYANIPLEEIIEIRTNNLFKNSNIVDGLKKSEFLSKQPKSRILYLIIFYTNNLT